MTELTGRVILPDDPGWDEARRGFAAWADYDRARPAAIAFCQRAEDVVNAIRWARERNVPIRARSGRHSYEAYSSLAPDGVIADVSEIGFVRVACDRATARVGAGIRVIDLSEALGQIGVAVPLATGKSVGLAGLALGGGFGLTSRKWGLTCDSLVDVEMVLSNGDTIHANEADHPDLFWACRGGGGGNFGIAVAMTLRVHPVKNAVLFTVHYAWDRFEAAVDRFQDWIGAADDGITAFLSLLTTREITLAGLFTADDDELASVSRHLAPMLDPALCPIATSVQTMPHLHASRLSVGVDSVAPKRSVDPHMDSQIFKSSSAFAYDRLPSEAIELLRHSLERVPRLSAPPSQPSMVQLLGGGGAISRVDPTATAAFHRKAKFAVQYNAYWTAASDADRTLAWIGHFRDLLSPYTLGAYVNYVDCRLERPLEQYYGANLARLVEIKRKYDPDNLFRFPQGLSADVLQGATPPGAHTYPWST